MSTNTFHLQSSYASPSNITINDSNNDLATNAVADGNKHHLSPTNKQGMSASARTRNLLVPLHDSSRTLRRRSSRISQWIDDQQSHVDVLDDGDPSVSGCNPYLAYPHLSVHPRVDDAGSLHSYVVLHDDARQHPSEPPAGPDISQDLAARRERSRPRSTIRITNPPSSIRNFHLSFPSASPSATSSVSRSTSRFSVFQRSTRASSHLGSSIGHHRSQSASQQTLESAAGSLSDAVPPSMPQRWRPSVLGHFSLSPESNVHTLNPESCSDQPRPSMSSTNTYSSTIPTISDEDEVPSPPSASKNPFFLKGIQSHTRSVKTALFKTPSSSTSSHSLWSLPTSASHLPDPPRPPPVVKHKASAIRLPFSGTSRGKLRPQVDDQEGISLAPVLEYDPTQPHVVYSSSRGPRLSLSSINGQSRSKKKKLVISGIGTHDRKRFEAAKRWCQSFGEVDQITRMPNGDLHVNFHKAEVADNVCCLRARVNISGVGSVNLSWYTGNKRP